MIKKKAVKIMAGKAAADSLSVAWTFIDPKIVWVMFIDYAYVIAIYVTCAFVMSVLIDGYILRYDDIESIHNESNLEMYVKILLQLALQGFVVIVISLFIQEVPSPVEGVNGYDPHSRSGLIIRNPAIITVILFYLSRTLRTRISILFDRITGVNPQAPVRQESFK